MQAPPPQQQQAPLPYPPPFTNYYQQPQQQYAPPSQQAPVEAQPQQSSGASSAFKSFGSKLGNAAIFGAGSAIGSDIVNSYFLVFCHEIICFSDLNLPNDFRSLKERKTHTEYGYVMVA
ncbi:Lsb1p [Saccharomyces cerevisiae AWRI796]|nr:Lsb1p [Saccharomyces cerevisiae AWRI796]